MALIEIIRLIVLWATFFSVVYMLGHLRNWALTVTAHQVECETRGMSASQIERLD